MKKFLFGMCMLAVVGTTATSCGNGDSADADNDSIVAKATSDSISQYYGMMTGSFISGEISYYANQSGEAYNREEFIKGLQAVVGNEKDEAYIAGMASGFRVWQELKEMEKQGVQVNRGEMLKQMRKFILADSVSQEEAQKYAQEYQKLIQNVQAKAQAREEAKKANSPEAKANEKAGREFIAKVPGVKTTQTGLGYVIENEGEGANIKDGDRVTLNYKGKRINGEQFDQGSNAVFQAGKGTIPGFGEGLKLLKKGSKATLYIPGHLAYGVNGVPQAKIGPNELLIFEIEVSDVVAPVEHNDNGQIK